MDDSQDTVFQAGHTYTRDETWVFDGHAVQITLGPWVDHGPPKLPPLTLAQLLEIDARIYGTCYVKLTDDGPVRVDPRKVLGE